MNLWANIIVDVVSLIAITTVWAGGRKGNPMDTNAIKLFNALLAVIAVIFIMDISGWILDGKTFYGARFLLYFSNTVYYFAQIIYCYLWLLFSDYWNIRDYRGLKKRALLYSIVMVIEIVIIFGNIKHGWIFTINGDNLYERGELFYINILSYAFYIFFAICLTIYNLATSKDQYTRKKAVLLLVYMFLPVCGTIIEVVVYGITVLWPFVALCLFMVYLAAQQRILLEERLAAAEVEAELADSRVAVMVSQIQPHFLYNSLTSIYALCEIDPKRAQQAVDMFSRYLRFNMDSLKNQNPVTFAAEMNHVKIYLDLEKMRFDEKLNIVYDIRCEGFQIPSLTLQPIVENAVKHGLGKKTMGGTLTIATRELEDCITITVTDDGVGFDAKANMNMEDGHNATDERRSHIGIDNVRARLEKISQASLEIKSEIGKGTIAIIRIPKEAKE